MQILRLLRDVKYEHVFLHKYEMARISTRDWKLTFILAIKKDRTKPLAIKSLGTRTPNHPFLYLSENTHTTTQ